jgi:hypothetical protein
VGDRRDEARQQSEVDGNDDQKADALSATASKSGAVGFLFLEWQRKRKEGKEDRAARGRMGSN